VTCELTRLLARDSAAQPLQLLIPGAPTLVLPAQLSRVHVPLDTDLEAVPLCRCHFEPTSSQAELLRSTHGARLQERKGRVADLSVALCALDAPRSLPESVLCAGESAQESIRELWCSRSQLQVDPAACQAGNIFLLPGLQQRLNLAQIALRPLPPAATHLLASVELARGSDVQAPVLTVVLRMKARRLQPCVSTPVAELTEEPAALTRCSRAGERVQRCAALFTATRPRACVARPRAGRVASQRH